MRRFQGFRHDQSESSEINISPLIDMVFILLIFFIVTTVFVEETGITIDRPRAASASELEKNSILLGISPANQVYYGGREIGIGGVRAVVRRQLDLETMPVIIQTDKSVTAETLMKVVDEAKLAGATSVSVSTEYD